MIRMEGMEDKDPADDSKLVIRDNDAQASASTAEPTDKSGAQLPPSIEDTGAWSLNDSFFEV